MTTRRSTLLTLLTAALVASLVLGGGSIAVAAEAVPTAPTSVTTSIDNTARSATIRWAPPTNTGGTPITGYTVARNGHDSSGSGPWSTNVPATTRSFTFTKLVPGPLYTLTMRAVTRNGAGTIASKTVTITVALPGAPIASPTAVRLDWATDSATINWAPPTDHGGRPITRYIVGHNGLDRTGVGPWSTTLPATARSFTFTKLGPNGDTVTVRAVTAAGAGPTATVAIYTGGPTITLQCSGNLSVVTNRTAGTATVAWTQVYSGNHTEPADGFRIARDGTDTKGTGPWSTSLPATARSFTFSYLRPGVTYTFTLTTFALWTTQTCTASIAATL